MNARTPSAAMITEKTWIPIAMHPIGHGTDLSLHLCLEGHVSGNASESSLTETFQILILIMVVHDDAVDATDIELG
jgi:hypothetical protein